MAILKQDTFFLDIFEGPLSLLLQLLQKNEIEIWDVSIQRILSQYLERYSISHSMETGAEFIGTTALLLLMKSKRLLPLHVSMDEETEFLDTNFEVIYQLLDYCRCKEGAKYLTEREKQQSVCHTRGVCDRTEEKKSLGIEHLSLQDIGLLFQELLKNVSAKKGIIHEEEWKVSDKIFVIRELLRNEKRVIFGLLFPEEKPRSELIATFLALLEMIKGGELYVEKQNLTIFITARGFAVEK
jgi:segregation and condensation protein A